MSPVEEHVQALVRHYLKRMQDGKNIAILSILEGLINAFMLAERDFHLALTSDNQANGSRNSSLQNHWIRMLCSDMARLLTFTAA